MRGMKHCGLRRITAATFFGGVMLAAAPDTPKAKQDISSTSQQTIDTKPVHVRLRIPPRVEGRPSRVDSVQFKQESQLKQESRRNLGADDRQVKSGVAATEVLQCEPTGSITNVVPPPGSPPIVVPDPDGDGDVSVTLTWDLELLCMEVMGATLGCQYCEKFTLQSGNNPPFLTVTDTIPSTGTTDCGAMRTVQESLTRDLVPGTNTLKIILYKGPCSGNPGAADELAVVTTTFKVQVQ